MESLTVVARASYVYQISLKSIYEAATRMQVPKQTSRHGPARIGEIVREINISPRRATRRAISVTGVVGVM